MGNIENTAVKELIARASGGPRPTFSSAHPPARSSARSPARMAAAIPPPLDSFQPDPVHTTPPVKMPVAAPFEITLPMSYPMGLGPRQLQELMHQPDQERMVPTFQMRRRPSEVRTVVSRLVFPIALLVSTGIVIGAYLAFGDHGQARAEIAAAKEPSAPPPVVAPAPVATPVAAAGPEVAALPATPAAPAAAAGGAPSLVDVRIESIPSGATVTLVDRGRTQMVGETPIDTAVDPARAYDLVFTYGDKPPHIEHLDPRTTRRVSVGLDAPEPPARPVAPAPWHAERAGRESVARRPSRARAEAAAGEGTLMISSKPPCEIVIDGRPTGLTTPQRSIALPAGHHRITLLSSEKAIKKTLTVQIAANTTEKVIEDLMR